MADTIFENELRLTIGNTQLFREPITESETVEYLRTAEEFGEEVAKTNLLLNMTKRLINAKRIQVSYFKDQKGNTVNVKSQS